jgi:hypothetical protein
MSTSEPVEATESVEPEFESWDAFWTSVQRAEQAERTGPPTQTIRGVTVTVPHDLPLLFERKVDQLKSSDSQDAFKELLADLFGVDVLDAWTENGMTAREFETVLAWGMANGKGREMSFREAYELVRDKQANGGKAGGSTRKSGKSGGSGRSSKPTSAANTSSPRSKSAR